MVIFRIFTFSLLATLLQFSAVETSVAEESFESEASQSDRVVPLKLKGLSKKEILSKFGKPDRTQKKTQGRETWIFGESMVFFSKEKVMAWTDSGELAERSNLSAVRPVDPKELAKYSNTWENAWTPKSRQESRDEVLKSMIGSGEL